MSRKRVPKQSAENKSRKIPEAATVNATQGEPTDHLNPSFRFTHADKNQWDLSKWKADEIKDLMRALQKIEKHTWLQIKSQGSKTKGESVGCGYKLIKEHPTLPISVSDDTVISEMRVCQKKRIFGFRIDSIYCSCTTISVPHLPEMCCISGFEPFLSIWCISLTLHIK